MSGSPGLGALSRRANIFAADTVTVPRPRFRWWTRVVLPLVVLLGAVAVLAWSARDALYPAIQVHVVPVVMKPRGADVAGADEPQTSSARSGPERVIVQAPGWIEPSPYAVIVPALTDGVVKEVLAIEGQNVTAGDVLVRLIDDDAKLQLRAAEAQIAERDAAVEEAKSNLAAAKARAEEVRDEVERKRSLAEDGMIASAPVSRMELRLQAMQADVASAQAAVNVAIAARQTQEVSRDRAALALERTEVRAPITGVLLSRSVEPGTRISMAGPGPGEAHEAGVARIYDPAHLQVRVDVPLADAAKVRVGVAAAITTEAMPDSTFRGSVTSIVHEANIQRNTVQFKVMIENPEPGLKPEMLARVRFLAVNEGGGGIEHPEHGSGVLLLPIGVLLDRADDTAAVWVAVPDPRRGTLAIRRSVTLGADAGAGFIEIVNGLSATDRVVVDPPVSLRDGTRIHVAGEAPADQGELP